MSLNLLKSGKFEVLAFDTNKEKISEYKAKGVHFSEDIQGIAKKCEVIITMLPNHTHVNSICEGPSGIFSNISKNGLIIDCSTIAP